MCDKTWTIEHSDIGKRKVCGFNKDKSARRHALKHFMNPIENWQQLHPAKEPSNFIRQVENKGFSRKVMLRTGWNKECSTILDEASILYVDTTRKHTSIKYISRAGRCLQRTKDGRELTEVLVVVSSSGFYASFRDAEVSDMLTVYRPIPPVRRGPLGIEHYYREALHRFATAMAHSTRQL